MTLTPKSKGQKVHTWRLVPPSPTPQIGNRIVCPKCGNDWHFFEIAENVMLTTRYIQNPDGSFTPQSDESSILGEVKLYCAECQEDLSRFHNRLVEMLF